MFDLVVLSGKLEGKRLLLPLEKDIVVGREAGCQIVLASTLISRQHCRLRRTPLGVQVQDLSSQNGTFVNDVVIDEATLLVVGDILRIGAIEFEVQLHEALEPAPVAKTTLPLKKRSSDEKKSSGISDHEIAGWLSDHDTATMPSASDTTIIKAERTTVPTPTPPSMVAVKPPAPAAPPKPSRPRTVKEEAADIIRRHWAKVRGESDGNS